MRHLDDVGGNPGTNTAPARKIDHRIHRRAIELMQAREHEAAPTDMRRWMDVWLECCGQARREYEG